MSSVGGQHAIDETSQDRVSTQNSEVWLSEGSIAPVSVTQKFQDQNIDILFGAAAPDSVVTNGDD
jgi:hypothetical protein